MLKATFVKKVAPCLHPFKGAAMLHSTPATLELLTVCVRLHVYLVLTNVFCVLIDYPPFSHPLSTFKTEKQMHAVAFD